MSIEVKNLTCIYNEGTPLEKIAVDNVNLKIADKEFVGIIGHTGSGKSTFIQTLNALIKPTKGEVFINGDNLNENKEDRKRLRKEVGLVFQYPEHQLFETTVYQDVAFGPLNLGKSEEETREAVTKALEVVGLSEEYFEKSPFDLSGGQKRKIAIAGVIAMNPKILILDEPTAGLDPKSRDEILDNIKTMHKKLDITVIIISHSMEDVSKLVDRLIVFNKGKIYLDDKPVNIFKKTEELENIGLSSPQISILMKKLVDEGFDVPLDIYTIEEATDVIYNLLK